MRKPSSRLTALLLALALSLSCAACGGSDTEAAAMKLAKTRGTVAVTDGEGKDVTVAKNLGLYSGYSVETRSESYAWIDLDSVKLTKMDADSAVEITKDGKMLQIDVVSGSLFFNITQPLEDDESLTIRTSTMVVGIRGTCGWVTQDAAALLEGKVEVTAGGQSVTITAGEMAALTAQGTLEAVPLSDEDIPSFVRPEVEDDRELMGAVSGGNTPDGPDDSTPDGPDDSTPGGPDDSTPGGPDDSTPSGPVFVSWADAGLEDHVMDWRDENLAARMTEVTGITDREIMLSDVWELREPNLSYADISDISALSELTNLTRLFLNVNSISDISALSGLTNLTYLSLSSNSISDISALSGLPNLTILNLGTNSISDISGLSDLPSLTSLTMENNNISDISALGGLTNLTSLSLYRNSISDIGALSGLTALTTLYLSDNSISDISALSGLTDLIMLDLGGNSISDISALSGLTDLTELLLSRNNITDYSPVEFVPNLSK